jgi:thioredoxin reductase (NADPH)
VKPWDPPEETLIPSLEGLLADWQATADVPYDGIRVAGTLWSPRSHDVKEFLARNRTQYRWLDIEQDQAARALVDQARVGAAVGSGGLAIGLIREYLKTV